MKYCTSLSIICVANCLFACAPSTGRDGIDQRNPSLDYTRKVRGTQATGSHAGFRSPSGSDTARAAYGGGAGAAQVHYVKDYPGMYDDQYPETESYPEPEGYPESETLQYKPFAAPDTAARTPRQYQQNMPQQPQQDMRVYQSSERRGNDYNGPLSLGDPGVSASLWQESRSGNELFRDHRAFYPMDALTIVVSENSEGSKEADTEVKEEFSILAGITKFLNLETYASSRNPGLDPTQLIQADTDHQYKGEGGTTRKGSLKASISAMVAEVLPSGILRIEGEKIISVNNEEQIMVISGLVRPKDINAANEVNSSKIANLRVDYFGRGVVGEAQSSGWASRVIRKLWPF
ncbi:MAG: flagellar basal body L-ring protein FlgH [Bdellovibrionales bacterium]|nr:flagellar basal body L-ring protein FlgH [Bdellovibrionales bacterium]